MVILKFTLKNTQEDYKKIQEDSCCAKFITMLTVQFQIVVRNVLSCLLLFEL